MEYEYGLKILPRYGNLFALSAFARSIKYGKSKFEVLYPMTTSGSTSLMNSVHFSSMSFSSWKEMT